MSFVINLIFSVLTIIILNFFSKKKSFLVDKKKLKHKSFIGKDLVPLTGGIVIFFSLLILNNYYLIFFELVNFLGDV